MLDFESFATLLTESYERLWLVAAAITSDCTEAEDIVQEAALVALRKLDEFAPGSNFPAWMSHIVRLTALNYLKKSARRSTTPTDPTALDRAEPAFSQNGDAASAAISRQGRLDDHQAYFDDEVSRALSGVSDVSRACLLLRAVGQLSYAEIAETLDIPPGTAMSHVHRARQAMREQLQGRYGRYFVPTDDK